MMIENVLRFGPKCSQSALYNGARVPLRLKVPPRASTNAATNRVNVNGLYMKGVHILTNHWL